MRIAITGGAGFIGSNLVYGLLERGHELIVIDDFSTGLSANLPVHRDLQVKECSILDFPTLVRSTDRATTIVHLAARPSVPRSLADPRASHEVNATGTLNVLEAARSNEIPHVIVASSSSIYGSNPIIPKAESLKPSPVSPYAASKLATESYALAWAHSFGLTTLAFRFFNVFGPRQRADHAYAAVIPTFISAALSGGPLPVHGDGSQTRDFTFVTDLTGILVHAIESRLYSPEPVNLAFGGRSSLLDIIALLETILGQELEISFQAPRPGDVRDSQADQTRLRSLVPHIEPTGLQDALAATVNWYRSQN